MSASGRYAAASCARIQRAAVGPPPQSADRPGPGGRQAQGGRSRRNHLRLDGRTHRLRLDQPDGLVLLARRVSRPGSLSCGHAVRGCRRGGASSADPRRGAPLPGHCPRFGSSRECACLGSPGWPEGFKGGGSKLVEYAAPRNARDYLGPDFNNAESPALVVTVWITPARPLIRRLPGRPARGGSC